MKVTKTSRSKLDKTDFPNLSFGTFFFDHMLVCNYKDGKWSEAKISLYGPISMPPGSQVLHYG
jgi:branched-chain amino acid aminotransferase